jgi:hypothetical protein
MNPDQQQTVIDGLLSMQRRLVAALREALPHMPLGPGAARTVTLISDAGTGAVHMGHPPRPVQRIFSRALLSSVEIIEPPLVSRRSGIRSSMEIMTDGA